jgi:demethoxyubiquinone hydroxylase (CLK1/Coq7/Cat5 family)
MRFRFTIRDLLWFMVVMALAVGWWTDVKSRRYAVGVYEDYENRINKKYSDEIAELKRNNEWLRQQHALDVSKRQQQ